MSRRFAGSCGLRWGSEGHLLLEAETAQQGLQEAASKPPDLVLLDLGLPDMDGIEVIRRLREWTAVPIIIISAWASLDSRHHGLELGALDYITKPFSPHELLRRVNRFVEVRASRTAE